jgi:hypothetical protein
MAKQNVDNQRQAAYDQLGSANVGLISLCKASRSDQDWQSQPGMTDSRHSGL